MLLLQKLEELLSVTLIFMLHMFLNTSSSIIFPPGTDEANAQHRKMLYIYDICIYGEKINGSLLLTAYWMYDVTSLLLLFEDLVLQKEHQVSHDGYPAHYLSLMA